MKILNQSNSVSDFIVLQDNTWLERQRIAGRVVAGALQLLENAVKEKTTMTMLELNNMAEEYIEKNNCTATFKNYKGFPCGVCISVNKQLVHGVPSAEYRLQEGDVVSFDLGATYKSAIADSALTIIYGKPKSQQHMELIKNTEQALYAGINAIKIEKRLGCIGNAVSKYAKNKGHGCITQYGGHSLNWDTPHAQPFVPNKANENEGIRLASNLTLAIEPMLTTGSIKTWVDKDGWTVWCEADMSAHFEHTIFLHEDSVEIITDRNKMKKLIRKSCPFHNSPLISGRISNHDVVFGKRVTTENIDLGCSTCWKNTTKNSYIDFQRFDTEDKCNDLSPTLLAKEGFIIPNMNRSFGIEYYDTDIKIETYLLDTQKIGRMYSIEDIADAAIASLNTKCADSFSIEYPKTGIRLVNIQNIVSRLSNIVLLAFNIKEAFNLVCWSIDENTI